MPTFTTRINKGDPLHKIRGEDVQKVFDILENLRVKDGFIYRNGVNWMIVHKQESSGIEELGAAKKIVFSAKKDAATALADGVTVSVPFTTSVHSQPVNFILHNPAGVDPHLMDITDPGFYLAIFKGVLKLNTSSGANTLTTATAYFATNDFTGGDPFTQTAGYFRLLATNETSCPAQAGLTTDTGGSDPHAHGFSIPADGWPSVGSDYATITLPFLFNRDDLADEAGARNLFVNVISNGADAELQNASITITKV
jgi:hypothetical protein